MPMAYGYDAEGNLFSFKPAGTEPEPLIADSIRQIVREEIRAEHRRLALAAIGGLPGQNDTRDSNGPNH